MPATPIASDIDGLRPACVPRTDLSLGALRSGMSTWISLVEVTDAEFQNLQELTSI